MFYRVLYITFHRSDNIENEEFVTKEDLIFVSFPRKARPTNPA